VLKAKLGNPRTIPLSPFAAEIVRRQLAVREGDCAWVFPSPTDPGKPLDSVRRAWAAAKRAAGLLDHIVIHSLRHSFASAPINSGVTLFEIGRVQARSQLVATTRYAHHAQERLVAIASKAVLAWDIGQDAAEVSPPKKQRRKECCDGPYLCFLSEAATENGSTSLDLPSTNISCLMPLRQRGMRRSDERERGAPWIGFALVF
jgi:hypothetical protein